MDAAIYWMIMRASSYVMDSSRRQQFGLYLFIDSIFVIKYNAIVQIHMSDLIPKVMNERKLTKSGLYCGKDMTLWSSNR